MFSRLRKILKQARSLAITSIGHMITTQAITPLATTIDRDDDVRGEDVAVSYRTKGFYSINGRYELPCATAGISGRGLELCVMIKPKVGDKIVAFFDMIGKLDGKVDDITPSGVIMTLAPEVVAGLTEQFIFLSDRSEGDGKRRHFRIKPRTPETMIRISDRAAYPAIVVDFSISGASVETKAPIKVGDTVEFARYTRAKVVRASGDGSFGVEFTREFRSKEFSWNIRL